MGRWKVIRAKQEVLKKNEKTKRSDFEECVGLRSFQQAYVDGGMYPSMQWKTFLFFFFLHVHCMSAQDIRPINRPVLTDDGFVSFIQSRMRTNNEYLLKRILGAHLTKPLSV